VNGNHEQASMANLNGTADNVAVWAQTARNTYYPQPAPDNFYTGDAEPVEFIGQLRDYYAFTWGDALFVVIDPYWHSQQTVDNQFGDGHTGKKDRDLWNVTLGDAQYAWFKQTLESSHAKYKFVFTHHVLGIGQLRDYYAFTWGDALFVVIDPYWHSQQTVDNQFGDGHTGKKDRDLWNVTLGDAQYAWFKQTLESSNAKYKFVFTHHVLGTGRGGVELANTFEWGDAKNLSAHRTWDKTIHQLMVDNNVTIFFQGHDHIFARQELDGVIYQTLPEPANPFYSWENEDAFTSGDKFPNSGHVRVTVSPDGVTVDYVRSYLEKPDEVAFTYTVR